MTDFLIYDLKVAMLIAVFYMFYRLMLSKETFHRVNRLVLLLTAVASFVLPLCVITMHETVLVDGGMWNMEGDYNIADTSPSTLNPSPSTNGYALLFTTLFIIGMVATLANTLWSLFRILSLIKNSEQHPQEDGTILCVTGNADLAPFSWMHYIVMNRGDYETRDAAILTHERGHIRLHHSWDVLLVDLLTALQWFNPAIWMLRSDLRAIHEYEADGAVLSQGINARQYQYLLITKAGGIGGYSLANGITHSALKNRINMMLHTKSPRRSLLKLLALLPIVGVTLALNARTVTDYVYDEPQKQVPVKKGKKAGTIKIGSQAIQVKENNKPVTFQTLLVPNNYPMDGVPVEVVVDGKVIQTAKTDAKGKITLTAPIGSTVRFITKMIESNPQSDEVTETADIKEVVITTEMLEKTGIRTVAFGVPNKKENQEPATKPGRVFDVVEEMPQYPGGPQALFGYLAKNIKYPDDALKANTQGRVIVTFVVKEDGSISDARVVKSVSPSLDAEGLRVINAMPKWQPGKQNGTPVDVKYTVPITFRLDGNEALRAEGTFTPKAEGVFIAGDNSNVLCIVDGETVTYETVSKMDPKTIKNIDVLKDKASLEKYGDKGKNGVLLITTKK